MTIGQIENTPNFIYKIFNLGPDFRVDLNAAVRWRYEYAYGNDRSKWNNRIAHQFLNHELERANFVATCLYRKPVIVFGLAMAALMCKVFLTATVAQGVAIGALGLTCAGMALYALGYPEFLEQVRKAYEEEGKKAKECIANLQGKLESPDLVYTLWD